MWRSHGFSLMLVWCVLPLLELSRGEERLRAVRKQLLRNLSIWGQGWECTGNTCSKGLRWWSGNRRKHGGGGGGGRYQLGVNSAVGRALTTHPGSGMTYHTSLVFPQCSCRSGRHGVQHDHVVVSEMHPTLGKGMMARQGHGI
jgi:hypothetical protein